MWKQSFVMNATLLFYSNTCTRVVLMPVPLSVLYCILCKLFRYIAAWWPSGYHSSLTVARSRFDSWPMQASLCGACMFLPMSMGFLWFPHRPTVCNISLLTVWQCYISLLNVLYFFAECCEFFICSKNFKGIHPGLFGGAPHTRLHWQKQTVINKCEPAAV